MRIPVCPDCIDNMGDEVELVDASYSPDYLVCPKCDDEFEKP